MTDEELRHWFQGGNRQITQAYFDKVYHVSVCDYDEFHDGDGCGETLPEATAEAIGAWSRSRCGAV